MYGGHIINDFDRTLASTYMDFFMREELLDEMVLYPHPDAAVAAHMEVSVEPLISFFDFFFYFFSISFLFLFYFFFLSFFFLLSLFLITFFYYILITF